MNEIERTVTDAKIDSNNNWIFNKGNFTGDQLNEILIGVDEGIDTSIYCDDEYTSDQMREIRTGLICGLDV